ncbi:hypothetical protein OG784_12645 [Streptomyces sp. NBC_01617]|uniref:hypothetical protein n=1 Tax=Streptomyces sp. NBC_01617 TaxID=2975899 RepID=UPI00386ED8E9|nr:hypothetical protein OG784_12645 [Streptomyces sp. NBC_01617]
MERQQIFELYEWDPGICFRHPDRGVVDTTVVQTLRPRLGPAEEVRACRQCVVAMEAERRARAEELGVQYEPGHAGNGLDHR